MALTITCPSCNRRLHVAEAHLGEYVQCPSCQATFTAELPAPRENPTASLPFPGQERVQHARQEQGFKDLDAERRDVNYPGVPHRGALILTLGILGLLLSCCPLAGWVLGILAMSLGNEDLRQMALGGMDRSGKGLTQAGKVLGLVAVIVATFSCILNGWIRLKNS